MHALAQAWLSLQCKMISGVSQGIVILGSRLAEPLAPTASWPIGSKQHPGLSAAAKIAATNGKGIAKAYQSGESSKDIIACPIIINNEVLGVVAIETSSRDKAGQQALLQMLQLGALWLTFILDKEKASQKDRLISVVELIATSLDQNNLHAATTSTASDLATRLACDRVSIGFLQGKNIQVSAISKTARFDKKSQIIRDIGIMMDEARDQDRLVVIPALDRQPYQITISHQEFIKKQGDKAICTIPLVDDGMIIGAICFERSREQAFNPETIELIKQIAQFIGPVFELKRNNKRGFFSRIMDSGKTFFSRLLGQDFLKTKAALILLSAFSFILSTVTVDYRVTANASLTGITQRAIVAPVEGYIDTAEFRAGDHVVKNELLVKLSDKDLKLERVKWLNQRQQLQKEYRTELARHDRSKIGILSAKIKQADTRIALLDEQLTHTEVRSPFDGIIVTGDLSNNLGSPVEKGQVLFELAPRDDYRIVLEVDETEIATVKKQQQGQLILSALPGENISFSIDKITPVAKAEKGGNYFRVEALLEKNASEALRPGMQGIGKINIDERNVIWIWTHKFTDWFKLWLWSWQA